MALPEIIKDIDARIIRPTSTDNAIVRFDGITGQVQNTANIIDDGNNINISGNLIPRTNSALDLGTSSYRFNKLYLASDIYINDSEVFLRNPWWVKEETHNADTADPGITFAYASHNVPTNGLLLTFNCTRGTSGLGSTDYPMQFIGQYNGNSLYYRHKNGDNGTWMPWKRILTDYDYTSVLNNTYVKKSGDTMTGMLRVNNAPIFGYRYGQSQNAPAFILDKPSSHYSGIGANGSADTIYFGAVNTSTLEWENSYKQKWVFNGSVTADTFDGKATQDGNGNVIASTYLPLSGGTMTGRIDLPYNLFSLQFREGSYTTGTYYGTLGNECLAFVARQAVTSFMFVTGSDLASWTSSTWNSSSPALQIKGQSVYVNSLIANGVSPSYNFYVNGTSYFNGTVIATMFKGDTSVAGILPQQSNEINFSSNGSAIWFGYRTPAGSSAVSVYNFGNSSGSATGQINAGTVYGAVWNDYAEFRSSDPVEPGRVVCETGDGTLELSTERLQPGANVVSDTFGFAIGETENCKTPIAVSGRALVYTYEDRYSYKAGDPVCAAPDGTVSKMSREEVMMYPDRIVGTVSEIPEYERWGTGNVEVKNRIWIKIK